MIRKYYYSLHTEKGTINCRDLQAAEYLYGCRKHATIIKRECGTGIETVVATK